MNLEQLANTIDRLKHQAMWDEYKDLTIAVVTDDPSVGPRQMSTVVNAHVGSDWESNRFLICCEDKLTKKLEPKTV
jgi:hypothetical protein